MTRDRIDYLPARTAPRSRVVSQGYAPLGTASAVRPALHGYQVLGFAARTTAHMLCFRCGSVRQIEGTGIRRKHGRILRPLFNGCSC